jgi:phosphonate transport system substrate-binding protein
MDRPLKVGAVMYDPKVSVIWDIIRNFFESQACPIDVAFYSTYELQVAGLLDRTIDIAWNSPLAWLDSQRRSGGTCRAVAMRDTDCDRVSYFVARREGPVRTLAACEIELWRPARPIRRRRRSFRSDGCGGRASIR